MRVMRDLHATPRPRARRRREALAPRGTRARRRRRSRRASRRRACPARRTAATESPPPTTVVPCARGERRGDRQRAVRERARSRRCPSGRSRRRRCGGGDLGGEGLRGRRADVDAEEVVGKASARDDLACARRPPACRRRRWSTGSRTRTPRSPRRARASRARASTLIVLDARAPDRLSPAPAGTCRPSRRRSERLHALEQALEHGDLVGDLGAAEDGDERPLGRRAAAPRGPRPRAAAESPRPSRGRSCAMPTVEACARCAVPKASFT